MKKLIPIIALSALLCGCDENRKPAAEVESTPVRYVNGIRVFVVEIDGTEYVVANSGHGLTICPKTKP